MIDFVLASRSVDCLIVELEGVVNHSLVAREDVLNLPCLSACDVFDYSIDVLSFGSADSSAHVECDDVAVLYARFRYSPHVLTLNAHFFTVHTVLKSYWQLLLLLRLLEELQKVADELTR